MFCFALANLTSPSSECQKQKSPAPIPAFAETERRARFSYDDLLELFSFAETYEKRSVTALLFVANILPFYNLSVL